MSDNLEKSFNEVLSVQKKIPMELVFKYNGVIEERRRQTNYVLSHENINHIPVGLKAKEWQQFDRYKEIKKAIIRYYNAEFPIPEEWVEELNDLLSNPKLVELIDQFIEQEKLTGSPPARG